MGNRCLIVPKGQENLGVYLHWNGGVDSVTAFLTYCKMKEYRPFGGKNADGYGIARLCQVIGNYFGGALSIGIEAITEELTEDYADAYDNGIYIIDGWEICKRISPSGHEGYDLMDMLIDIDNAQPEGEQLGEDYLKAEEVDAAELEIGDKDSIHALYMEGNGYQAVIMPVKNYDTDKNTGEKVMTPPTNLENF